MSSVNSIDLVAVAESRKQRHLAVPEASVLSTAIPFLPINPMARKPSHCLPQHLDATVQQELIDSLPVGVVYCKVLYKNGKADDILHLYTNPAYNKLSGLDSVIGRRLSEIVPEFRDSDPWILTTYGHLMETGVPVELRRFVVGMNKWASIRAYRPTPDHFIAILTDISEGIQTESLLVRQLATSHALLNNSLIGLVVVKDRHIVWANQVIHDMLGYAVDELAGQPTRIMFADGESYESFGRAVYTELARGKNYRGTWEQVCKNGSHIFIDFNISPMGERESGEVVGALVDVTSSHGLHDRLAKQRSRALEIIEAANIGTWEWDVQADRAVQNDKWHSLLGYQPNEISVGSYAEWQAFIHPDDMGPLTAEFNRHLAGEIPFYEFETRLHHKDGRWIWFNSRGRVMERGPNGEPLQMFGTIMDISERVKAREQHQRDLERLQLALAGADVGTWESSLVTGEASYDQRLCAMVGYTVGEMTQTIEGWLELMHPEDRIRVQSDFQRNFDEHIDHYESEFRLRHKDGHWVWIYSRGKIFRDAEGKPTHAAGTHLDITDRKRLKSESTALLRQIEEMIRSLRDHPGQSMADAPTNRSVEQLLSKRQLEVLKLIATGMTSAKIAECLGISRDTVIGHRRDLMRKIDAHNTADITRFALAHQLIVD